MVILYLYFQFLIHVLLSHIFYAMDLVSKYDNI